MYVEKEIQNVTYLQMMIAEYKCMADYRCK